VVGIVLFLLGLVTGLVSGTFKNLRLGLAAHLEALMNGMFLVVVGLIWNRVELSSCQKALVFWLLCWGAYANWWLVFLAVSSAQVA
jgi:(hydroxyamino)benzene mutase